MLICFIIPSNTVAGKTKHTSPTMTATNPMRLSLLAALAILTPSCNGFVVPAPAANTRIASSAISMTQHENSSESNTRRSVLSTFFTSAVAITAGASSAFAEAETLERGGVKLTPFNSLAFNYRGECFR